MHRRLWRLAALLTAAFIALIACATLAAGKPHQLRARAGNRAAVLSLIAEPAAGNRPFIALIKGARRTLELTMYQLDDKRLQAALAGAARRGVDVRVILNGGYYGNSEDRGQDENGAAYDYLRRHRVQVHWAPAYFALTHQKTLTVDGRQSAVMTLNFDGRYATTRDFAILDRQHADVSAIVSAFNADWKSRRITPSSGSGDLIWSPGAAAAFTTLINGARRSLDVEDEEMDYAPITDDLCAAARRRVQVHVVMSYDSEWKSALAYLQRCGAKVHLFHGQAYYIHAKVVIADGRTALVSSQNFSTTSLDYNRELGIRVRHRSLVNALARDFASDYARS